MKILGLIPARGGSKGIPGKNIKLLAGKPLLQYTWESAMDSGLKRIILSSDDPEIITMAEKMGMEVPFIRPEAISRDDTPTLEVVKHALKFFQEKGTSFDAVCLLQPTSPLRSPGLIQNCIRKFSQGDYDSLISVREVPTEYNPHWTFEEKEGVLEIATGEEKIIPRRQELPKAYYRDGAVYLTRTAVILEQQSLFGKKIGYFHSGNAPVINLDTPADWLEAEKILRKCAE